MARKKIGTATEDAAELEVIEIAPPGPEHTGFIEEPNPEWDKLSPLERAHAAMRARREAGEVIVRLDPIEKARAKPTSLRLAITGKCWDCVGGMADPNPRARIRDCGVTKCTLYPVRPYQKSLGNSGFVETETDEPERGDDE